MKTTKNAFIGKTILALVLVLLFCTPAFALTPEIHSIVPDHGARVSPTDVTIHGANFKSTPKVAIYGDWPTIIGSADTPGGANGVYVLGNYAYVADGSSGLQVIDVSDPINPTIVGSADTPDSAVGVYVLGNHAYVADNGSGLQVIDITDPENPTIVGSADTPDRAVDVFVSGNYAYVADGSSGLQVIDITAPTSPTIVGSVDTPGGWASDVFVSGNHAYVADGGSELLVLDITDPANPTIIGSVDTRSSAYDVFVSGSHAYVTGFYCDGVDGCKNPYLQAIDISDPKNPTIVGSTDIPGFLAVDVFVSGNYAYVANDEPGMQVTDVSDPANPTIVGSAGTPGFAYGVYVSGDHVYVADEVGLQVLRAFEPCTNVTFVDSSTLTATVPAGFSEGTYNLHVVNPEGERAILYNSFTVLPVFQDVPSGYWAEDYIYKIYNAGITTGCSTEPLRYCPTNPTNRTQMAVFLERGMNGGSYIPPPATGLFYDVPLTWWAVDWIEQFYNDGITSGCRTTPLMYCPINPVTRIQMAVFLLRAKHGGGYTPPAATGIFDDVPLTWWAVDWIEQLYREGITTGCSTNPLRYCPTNTVNRAQMAAFIVRTFGL